MTTGAAAETTERRQGGEERFHIEISDVDRDSLHILPLAIIPMQTRALRHARMIKNSRLEGVVELFEGPASGSGQVEVDSIVNVFGWPVVPPHPDLMLLRKLAALPSYDVYSLRIMLRQQGIAGNEVDALRLSPRKVKELTALFRNPNVKQAQAKLQQMADSLGIGLAGIPRFLEDYGDIFLSLAYYRNCLDQMVPAITEFLKTIEMIRQLRQLAHDEQLMTTCAEMEATINGLMVSIAGRFENFERSTKDIWQNISAERFRRVESLIKSYHTTIGGVLCSLAVKIDAWAMRFPRGSAASALKQSQFIMFELRHGFEKIQQIEDSAPMLSAI
ncbi:MAG TPA: hypothetical protein VLR47_07790 [Rhodospirillales bacterium]|nr:hypothetical protein [Rhodospirillales bacterium]